MVFPFRICFSLLLLSIEEHVQRKFRCTILTVLRKMFRENSIVPISSVTVPRPMLYHTLPCAHSFQIVLGSQEKILRFLVQF
jgi:hypothetical protein